jgi:thymidylate synthase
MKVEDIREEFLRMYDEAEFNESGLLEIVGASFEADEDSIFGTVSEDYITREIEWYNTTMLNVHHMKGKVPKTWLSTANSLGEVNSNYGWCIFSKENGYQYLNVLQKLQNKLNTKRACMIYTRPSMHNDAVHKGMNDFICTNAVTYSVSDNKLNCVVQMRSNDVVYGYKNDLAWQKYVLFKLANELEVEIGTIVWQAASLHIYKNHFKLLRND